MVQVLQFWLGAKICRQIRGDVFTQRANGLSHRLRAAVLLAGQKQELRAVGFYHVEKDTHRSVDHTAHEQFVVPHQANGFAKGLADFTD